MASGGFYRSIKLIIALFMALPLSILGTEGWAALLCSNGNIMASTLNDSKYVKYVVQPGDTLDEIASQFSVPVSDIVSDNNIDNKDIIYVGQKLFIRSEEKTENRIYEKSSENGNPINREPNKDNGTNLSAIPERIAIDVRDADIRDVLSALALYMDSYLLFVDEPVRVTFSAKDVTPLYAMELLIKSVGLDYLQDGNLIVVGKTDKLKRDFFSQMVLTRFDLKYITGQDLKAYISQLGVSAQTILVDENPKSIWVQGTPQTLGKVKEIIWALDQKNNLSGDNTLTEIILTHITAEDLTTVLRQMSVQAGIVTIDSNPKTLWVKASSENLNEIKQIAATLDRQENANGVFELVRVDLSYITADKLIPILDELDIQVEVVYLGSNPTIIWLQGLSRSIAKANQLIGSLDVAEANDDSTLFVFRLNNIVAKDAAERLGLFQFEGVRTITFSYPEFGRDLLVICPYYLKTKVTRALEGLDWRGLGYTAETIAVPVDSATGPYAYMVLDLRRQLLIDLIDELEDDADMIQVSDDLYTESGESYRVLIVEGSPDLVQRVRNMIDLIKSP